MTTEDVLATRRRYEGAASASSDEVVRAVTPRSVAAAIAVIAATVWWDEWMSYYIDGSNISRSHFPLAFLFPFLCLCVLNMLMVGYRPAWGLSRPELLVVLGSGLVGAVVPYDGVTGHLIGIIAAPYYFATAENGWQLYLHEHIPKWLAPQNTGNEMTWFYEGAPEGGISALGAWATPLFWWTCLLGAMALAVFCLVVMLRKQWADHERLAYPLVEVGRMLTETEPEGRLPAFFRSPLFWMGFGLVMALKMWNVASYFSPAVPRIPIEGGQWQAFPDFPYLIKRISFYAIGFGYFARLDVLFSVWFFILLTAFQLYVCNRVGYSVWAANRQWASIGLGWQSMGALLFLAVWGLWMARRHLRDVWRKAVRSACDVDDSGELLSYRAAVFGLMGSLLFAAAWLHAAGMELWVVLVFLPVSLLMFLGLSRVIAELGLVYVYYQVQPYDAVLQAFGTPILGPSSVVSLCFMRVFNSIGKGFLMPAFTQAVKAVDRVVKPRRITAVIWVALGLAFAFSLADTLFLGYENGAYNLGNMGLRKVGPSAFNNAVTTIRNVSPFGGKGRLLWAGIGAAVMAILTLVRYRVPWWPLHPIGLAVQGHYGVTKTCFSTLIAWAIKSTLMRIGGVALYERGKPFFIGLLVAQAVSTAIVFGIDWVWFPTFGHNVHNY